jgi:hypothetical protein
MLLVLGPVVAAASLAYPPMFRVWTVPREQHLALIRTHRLAWTLISAGFTVATVMTAAGLVVLAGAIPVGGGSKAVIAAAAVGYAIAGTLWCAVLAIRARTTPAFADMVAAGTPTEPAETVVGDALGGLFAAFILITGAALVAVALVLTATGVVAQPVGGLAALIAAFAAVGFLAFGDMLPAVVYLPTELVGIAILLGWS